MKVTLTTTAKTGGLTINEIMFGSNPIMDPCGIPGALRWDTPGSFRNKIGTWELVLHPEEKIIYHYNFVSD
ncbi:unknown protein [Waddlia chondrophila 2032/99]|uniref:Uncharacterized protein n=1 Tax=Waddlia chondrophila 2032/99 TaxID=765953 RepID=F8LE66_9BACT|nr:unknown protein [Waddlia chondrophila 2032/99]